MGLPFCKPCLMVEITGQLVGDRSITCWDCYLQTKLAGAAGSGGNKL